MWTPQERELFNNTVKLLQSQIDDLRADLDQLIGSGGCSCDCKTIPHYKELLDYSLDTYFTGTGYDMEAVMNYLNPNDRFPVPACPAEKAIIFCSDATVYLWYHDQDFWIIESISRVNNYKY